MGQVGRKKTVIVALHGFWIGLAWVIASQAVMAEGSLEHRIAFCPTSAQASDANLLERCVLAARPPAHSRQVDNDQQLMRISVINSGAAQLPAQLFVGPYYLARMRLYALEPAASTTLIGQAGAFLGGDHANAAVGGHVFTIPAPPGQSEWLLALQAPGFAQVSLSVYPQGAAVTLAQDRAMGVGIHVGMLCAFAALALVGVSLQRNPTSLRLFILTALIALQNALGSGLISINVPALPGEPTMMVFMLAIVARNLAWGWLFQALIQPYNKARRYRWAGHATYALVGLAAGFYLFDATVPGRIVTFALIFAIPAVHLVGAIQATSMPTGLRRGLVTAQLAYMLLTLLALIILTRYSGQSDLPILLSRTMDLVVPAIAMGVVLLSNRASAERLAASEKAIAQRDTQLMAERRAQEEKRTLLDIVTHEIRNPLATIRLASQGLNVSLKDQSTSKSRLGNIQRAIDAIDEMIGRCDLYNRLESGGIQPEAEVIDLAAMVNELAEQWGLRSRATIDGNSDTPVISDSKLLSILLGNLFDNARKYARHDSPVQITVDTAAQGGWQVVVRNSVEPGRAPDPERIFERYYRKDTDSPLGGSGLGLPLARHIAQALGGELTYRAHQDEVCFSLNIQGD